MQREPYTKHLLKLGLMALVFLLVACASPKEEEKASPKEEPIEGTGQPKIVAVEKEIDFGEIKQGNNVERVFTIKNEGDAVLNIERARGS